VLPADSVVQASEVPDRIRYCNRCGSARDADSSECPQCDRTTAAASAAQEQYQSDVRSIRSALWLYFALLGLSAILLIWQIASGDRGSAVAEFVSSGAFSLLVLGWCLPSLGMIFKLLTVRFHAGWILGAMVAAIPTYLLASGAVELLVSLGVERAEYLETFFQNGFGFGWAVLLVCVQPAIFEELAFRGIIQGSLGRVLGEQQGLIVSALMFGILHLSIPSLPHLLVLGMILGWLRLRTNSLIPGMVLHFFHNFFVILSEQIGSLLPW
jgi:uncharacterized protein